MKYKKYFHINLRQVPRSLLYFRCSQVGEKNGYIYKG